MRDYKTGDWINKKKRKKWIKENKKFIYSLCPTSKFIMLILYNNKEMFYLYGKLKVLSFTYSHICKQFQLLGDIGFLKKKKIGRKVRWSITRKGEKYCEVLLRELR